MPRSMVTFHRRSIGGQRATPPRKKHLFFIFAKILSTFKLMCLGTHVRLPKEMSSNSPRGAVQAGRIPATAMSLPYIFVLMPVWGHLVNAVALTFGKLTILFSFS